MSISVFFIHTVTVQTWLGAGATGDQYAASAPVACFIEDKVQLVRDSSGEEVVSSTTVYAALTDAGKFPPESLVTTWDNEPTQVIGRLRRDGGPLGLPDHAEIHLR